MGPRSPPVPMVARIPMAAPAPRAMIPEGEVRARATGGEKNRSRKLSDATPCFYLLTAPRPLSGAGPDGQKLETTAVKTLEMVAGLLAS